MLKNVTETPCEEIDESNDRFEEEFAETVTDFLMFPGTCLSSLFLSLVFFFFFFLLLTCHDADGVDLTNQSEQPPTQEYSQELSAMSLGIKVSLNSPPLFTFLS